MPRLRTKRKFYDELEEERESTPKKKQQTTGGRGRPPASASKGASGKKKVAQTSTRKKHTSCEDYNGDEYDSDANDDLYESDSDGLASFFKEEAATEEAEDDFVIDDSNPAPTMDSQELVCPWIDLDPEAIPELVLPPTSQDIPLPVENIMDVVELYEIVRSYYQTLKLTPFIFEDFCAALTSPENTRILAEVHICLFKTLLKNDDEEQVHYSVMDTNNAYNIIVHSMDSMTYAEVLRVYVEADPSIDKHVVNAIAAPNYPFVGLEQRLVVLLWLAYRFLETNEYKRLVERGGRPAKDEVCRICTKAGGMASCDVCEVCVHPTCSKLIDRSDEDLHVCGLCQLNLIPGAMLSRHLPPNQMLSRAPLRMEPIGRDRHGRIYWFVARRIFVQEDEEEPSLVHYYSTAPQFYELISRMDPNYYEYDLCCFFLREISTIMEQMAITLELTADRRENMKNYFMQQAQIQQRQIHSPKEAYLLRQCAHTMANILLKLRAKAYEEPSPTPVSVLEENVLYMLGFQEGELVNTFWSATMNEQALLNLAETGASLLDSASLAGKSMFRIGQPNEDHSYMQYRNHFTSHELGEHPNVKKKAFDRRKYMSTRFAIMEEGDGVFEWSTAKNRDLYGNARLEAKSIAWTIGRFLRKIPDELMHRTWLEYKEGFMKDLNEAESVEALRWMLLRMECLLRRTLFVNQWWNSVGLVRLTRSTQEQRELQTKEFLKKKKEEKEMATEDYDDENRVWIKYTKAPLRKTLWRIKDEMYRLNWKNGLGGWLFVSNNYVQRVVSQPEFPKLELDLKEKNEAQTMAFKKRARVNNLLEKLYWLREEQAKERANEERAETQKEIKQEPQGEGGLEDIKSDITQNGTLKGTNSTTCLNSATNKSKKAAAGDSSSSVSLISGTGTDANSQRRLLESDDPSASTAVAFKLRHTVRKAEPGEVVGVELPWPHPQPFLFTSNGTKRKSIWIIPRPSLRKLSRTGGNEVVYIPGFSTSAKSNFTAWNYPSYRPTFEHCWKWRTLHCRSLHAIALQLKILWYSIRWMDMHPEDNDPDRRVVHHLIDRDERREIVDHREFPPYGTYERYKLRIEVFPLDDDTGDDDNPEYKSKGTKRRRKGPRLMEVKEEWIDGVELRLHEIKDYWTQLIWPENVIQATPQLPPQPQQLVHYVTAPTLTRPPPTTYLQTARQLTANAATTSRQGIPMAVTRQIITRHTPVPANHPRRFTTSIPIQDQHRYVKLEPLSAQQQSYHQQQTQLQTYPHPRPAPAHGHTYTPASAVTPQTVSYQVLQVRLSNGSSNNTQ